MEILKPDALAITEIKAKNPRNIIQESEIQIKDYELFHNLDAETVGRGVCIYIKESLNPNLSNIKPDLKESIWAEFKETATKKVMIGCIYRSPNSSEENNKKINTFIGGLGNLKNTELILVGDYNYPKIIWDEEGNGTTQDRTSQEFLENIRNAYLTQHITEPTRYRQGQKENILDLVFTLREEIIEDIKLLPPIGKSDHCSMIFNVLGEDTGQKDTKTVYNYHKANYEGMKNDIKNIKWKDCINEVEEGWKLIKDTIHQVMEKHVPKSIIIPNKRRRPLWMNKISLCKVRKKHAAWKRYLETKSGEDYLKYTRARNQSRRETRKAQRDYESKLAKDVKNNNKPFWKYVHSKTKVKSKIPDLNVPGTDRKTNSDEEKAEVLNDYFKEVFTEEDEENIPEVQPKVVETELSEIAINQEEVLKKLKDINPNKSAGPDAIPARVLKELSEVLAEPLAILYHMSLKAGKLPSDWKSAHITPIYKKGGKANAGNYRPISLTVIICRKLEGLVAKCIVEHLLKHNFISPHQHGFLLGRNTVTQLLETLDVWTEEIDKGNNMNVLYCDFKKAFDTVPHKRLMKKIESYGVKGDVLNWIEDFLSGRKQRVCVNGKLATWKSVTSGVPQGSVLGPLLFVIYINDLEGSVSCGVKLYADDTKIYAVVNSDEDSEEFQKQINALSLWSITWKLHFHPDKCHILKIGNKPDEMIYTIKSEDNNTNQLEESTEEKDLGVTIDNKLNFRSHCDKTAAKANKLLGILRRNFTYINRTNFNYLYKGLIRPKIEYASQVYNPIYQQEIQTIESIQRRATKMVLGLQDKSYEERLKILKLPTLIYRRARGDLIQVYKYLHSINKCPEGMFNLAGDTRTRGHSLKLKKSQYKLNIRGHFFTYRVVNLWNALKEETISAASLNIFKNRLDNEWENKPWKYNRNVSVL